MELRHEHNEFCPIPCPRVASTYRPIFDPDVSRCNAKIYRIDQILNEFFAGAYGDPEVALATIGDIIKEETGNAEI